MALPGQFRAQGQPDISATDNQNAHGAIIIIRSIRAILYADESGKHVAGLGEQCVA